MRAMTLVTLLFTFEIAQALSLSSFALLKFKSSSDFSHSSAGVPKYEFKPESDRFSKVFQNIQFQKDVEGRYRQNFGITPQYQLHNLPRSSWFAGYGIPGKSEEEVLLMQRQFGEYVMRRIVEYEGDSFFSQTSELKTLYEAKEKLSNVELKVHNNIRANARYSFAGQFFELKLVNPWMESQIFYNMGSVADPFVVMIAKDFNLKLRASSYLYLKTERLMVSMRRSFAQNIGLSIAANVPYQQQSAERILFFGFDWQY